MKLALARSAAVPGPSFGRPSRHTLWSAFGAALVGVTLVALALALAVVLTRQPPSPAAVLIFGLGVLGSLAVAAVRYEALVALGILLLAIVQVEPAPSDVIFGVAIALMLASGLHHRRRLPASIVFFSAFFIALNLLSSIEVVDAARASFYLSITLYVLVFAFWLATWVDSPRKAALVANTYVATAVLSALFATLALFVAFPGHDLLVDEGRAKGFFKDANIYVSFLVPAAMIVAERAVTQGADAKRRAFAGTLFLVLVMGVLFSFSRAGWLDLAVALFVLGAVLFLRWEGRRVLVLAAILVAAGCVAFAAVERERARETSCNSAPSSRTTTSSASEHSSTASSRACATRSGSGPASTRSSVRSPPTACTSARSPSMGCSGC